METLAALLRRYLPAGLVLLALALDRAQAVVTSPQARVVETDPRATLLLRRLAIVLPWI